MGITGSLQPVKDLLDQYANNSEARQEFITNQLLSNPYDIKTTKTETTEIGNNNKILNSYFNSLGINFNTHEEENREMNKIDNLTLQELELMLDVYEDNPSKFDIDKALDRVKEVTEVKEPEE